MTPLRNVAVTKSRFSGWGAVMRLSVAVALCCLCSLSFAADPAHASIRKDTNIPPEGLGAALEALAKDYDFQVLYRTEIVKDLKTQGALGSLTSDEALGKVLSGTGLSYKYLDASTVTIVPLATAQAATTAAQSNQTSGRDNSKEAGKKSSQDFRVARVDQTAAGPQVASSDQNSKQERAKLEEVIVTGSRLPRTAEEGPQEVQIYSKVQIEQSGRTNVSDFLNTLPSVSISVGENGFQTAGGATTVQLRGLPFGTTLVLINGRRVETSGSQSQFDFFDLNNIPLAAVDRIEVVADGSSAVYGSDAIAGTVNIILKQNFDGLETNAKYGGASGMDETDASLAFGKRWDAGSFSIVGSYQNRTELNTTQRSITSSNNYTAFGGPDNNFPTCNPGNVYSVNGLPLPGAPAGSNATFAGVSSNSQSKRPTFADFNYGTLNECPLLSGVSLIPATNRAGFFAQGNYHVTPSVELFTELMYSHTHEYSYSVYQSLFGEPGFQSYTVSAGNPFNPFGETVGVSYLFTSVSRQSQFLDTDFVRPLVGARGEIFGRWHWEVSTWESIDFTNAPGSNTAANSAAIQTALNSANPATALNPFVVGSPGSPSLLQTLFVDQLTKYTSRAAVGNAYIHGPAFHLPAGDVELAVGTEYERDSLSSNIISNPFVPPGEQTFHRERYAVYAEARIPILSSHVGGSETDTLVFTMAGRHDHYNDFGSTNTPQLGLEFRPERALLFRATYAQAFKAPSLFDLYTPQTTTTGPITDPLTGHTYNAEVISGGNQNLQAETGRSHTFGAVYTSNVIPGLRLSVTNWNVEENKTLENLNALVLIDNPGLFPGHVIRAPSCSSGPPCPITEVLDTFVNFGKFDVAGIDYQLSYRRGTDFGLWTPSLSVSQTYHYTAALAPGAPATERVSVANDDLNWAPRWKGTVGLGWELGPFSASVLGRYVGKYQDYDSTREIGNFWLCDSNLRYNIGHALEPGQKWLNGTYIALGGVNLFNRLPQYSNYTASFFGYDPTQADIRGRYLYAEIGVRL
jgi:iron complex outermembrane receptor protein